MLSQLPAAYSLSKQKIPATMLWILAAASLCFCLYGLGNAPIHDWDEARNGQNALEMLRNGNWFYLTYNGVLDNWNAKPPGFIWLIVAGFKMFGVSANSLRFFSAVGAWICMLFVFRMSRLWCSDKIAILICAILLSTKGLLGTHTGRTGDFDAPLMASMMACCFYFHGALKAEAPHATGFYFKSYMAYVIGALIKGPAILQIMPGLLLYAAYIHQDLLQMFTKRRNYLTVLLGILPVGALLVFKYFAELHLQTNFNSVSLATVYDLWTRFTQPIEGHGAIGLWEQLTWVPSALDVLFGPWIYLLYMGLLVWMGRKKWFAFSNAHKDGLVFCGYQFVPLAILLTLGQSRLLWYAAPLVLSCALIFGILADALVKKHWMLAFVTSSAVLVALVIQHQRFVVSTPNAFRDFVSEHKTQIQQASKVCLASPPSQSQRLELLFVTPNLAEAPSSSCGIVIDPVRAKLLLPPAP